MPRSFRKVLYRFFWTTFWSHVDDYVKRDQDYFRLRIALLTMRGPEFKEHRGWGPTRG